MCVFFWAISSPSKLLAVTFIYGAHGANSDHWLPPRLLDAVVHTLEGSGPGRLELTSEMKEAGIRLYECHPGLVSKDSTISPLVELGASIIGVLSGG